ncbi:MAG: UDP-N-acetylmuramyl pentapeptide phosphotransferase [Desulfobacula sp.]|nr:UDP-N-acetylmuramyl pentapeptide phosphotransferase [Desulfobacula sp.]
MNLYFLSFIIGGLGAWCIVKYGVQLGFNDTPNHRSSHTKVVPKGGGIGILIALVVVSLILSIHSWFWFPALVISIVSLWGGDKHRFSPQKRLIIQFCCSIVFLVSVAFYKNQNVYFFMTILPLSIFIVGTANFYNFMDGIDGIAGTTAIVGFSLIAYYSYINGIGGPYQRLSISLAFACLGFLCFNFPRAKVFLGDIGSVLIGFIISCLMVLLSESVLDFFVLVGFLITFYFDEFFTMVVRLRDGDSLILGHRKHIYQLLANELAICHWKISLLYGFIQLVVGITIIFASSKGMLVLFLLYVCYGLAFICVSIQIHKRIAI